MEEYCKGIIETDSNGVRLICSTKIDEPNIKIMSLKIDNFIDWLRDKTKIGKELIMLLKVKK